MEQGSRTRTLEPQAGAEVGFMSTEVTNSGQKLTTGTSLVLPIVVS